MKNNAAAGGTLDTFPAGRNERQNILRFLESAVRDRWVIGSKEAKRGRPRAAFDVCQAVGVIAHVVPAREGRGVYETPVFEDFEAAVFEGFHRKLGSRAAFTSSKRRTGVV